VIGLPVAAQPALIGFNLDQGKDRWASIIDWLMTKMRT
jgi:hypothetical protein